MIMKNTKRKALTVLKNWAAKQSETLTVSDFVADWVLDDDDIEHLICCVEDEHGYLLGDFYSTAYSFYEMGKNKEFVEMLAEKNLYAEWNNAAEFSIFEM